MSNLPKPINLTAGGAARDYESIYSDLSSLIRYYTPEWTYQGDDDLGVVLLQLLSYLGDHLHYRADTTLRDMHPASTLDRRILKNLSNWLGYYPKRANPAQGEVTFSVSSALPNSVTIPSAVKLTASVSGVDGNDDSEIEFETSQAVILPAGALSVVVPVVEGATQRLVDIGTSGGLPYESFTIEDPSAVFANNDNDLQILVDNESAEFVRWPALAKSAVLTYWVRETPDGLLEIRFGDGKFGRLLQPGQVIRVTYRSGGGPSGLVAANAITKLTTSIRSAGSVVDFTVTNVAATFGGTSVEDIEEIRGAAPAFFRTQGRAVSVEDYKTLALAYNGVFRANPVRTGVNGVLIYIVSDNAALDTVLTAGFTSAVVDYLDTYRMATDVVDVAGATLVPIDVELNCFAFQAQRNATVRQRIQEAFTNSGGVLETSSNDLGQHLRRSDMVNIIEDVEGLDYVDVLKYTRRPSLRWVFATGNATLSDEGVTVSNSTVEEVFTITMLSATTFSVTGSVTGLQATAASGALRGTLGTPYAASTSSGGHLISFTLNAGSIAMGQGDYALVAVSPLASNIKLAPNEFPVSGNVIINVVGGIL